MRNILKAYLSKRFLPRWFILIFDLAIVSVTFVIAFLLRFNLDFSQASSYLDISQFIIILPLYTIIYYLLKSYAGIIRHSSIKDASSIFLAQTLGFFVLIIFNIAGKKLTTPFLIIPLSVICIHYALSSFILISSRVIIKNLYERLTNGRKGRVNIMIYGAGELGQITRDTLLQSNKLDINLIGFIDDNKKLTGKRNSGIPIFSPEIAFKSAIPRFNVTEVIIAISNIKKSRKRAIMEECIKHRLVVKEIPPVRNWIDGELNTSQIKKIQIEDLLGRESIKLDTRKIQHEFQDTTVLVTGAAGSIGSEIVRQLSAFNTKKIILLDHAETPVFKIQQELNQNYPHLNHTILIGDITNQYRMQHVFETYRPDIVFNAAAYKHVPLMESQPYEAIRVNLGGTRILADLAIKFNVKKFVMISTDKAVNPTNIMGASKRLSEIYIQSLTQLPDVGTKFITTRFGNVLGSNGSVVSIFEEQIKKGGPITVTHKDITRYFMTIPEACQLVLEASAMSMEGEIFLFDMGQPVRIYELAEKMISLSGLEPHKDIEIKITGLRPGEKLHEELLLSNEEVKPTHHKKIMINKAIVLDYDSTNKSISELLDALEKENDKQLILRMKSIIPEFTP